MPDPTAEFFEGLGRRGHEPMLRKVSGSLRFDLAHDHQVDHWHLAITNGDLKISQGKQPADAIVHAEKAAFDKLASGQAQPTSALLRNDVGVEGRLRLFVLLQRLLPGPSGAHDPRDLVSGRRP